MLVWTRVILICIIASDFLDGYLARRMGEVTALGSILDPLADKLFVTTSFVLLAVYERIPAWLAMIVVTKDVLVSMGWCFFAMLYGKVEVSPSILGKFATGFQFLTVCVIILFSDKWSLKIFEYVTAVLTIMALLHYGFLALKQSSEDNMKNAKETN